MIFFLILLAISGVGLCVIAWLMFNENKPQPQKKETPAPPAGQAAQKDKMTDLNFLKSFGIPELGQIQKKPGPEKTISLGGLLKKENPPQTGTASLRLDQLGTETPAPTTTAAPATRLSEEETKHLDLQKQKEESQAKYEKLETLLQEKNTALEKSERALETELQNRKEFNKVKDLLEKELKDSKNTCRDLQIALSSAQTEAQLHLKRIKQLEEKLQKVDKEVKSKDTEAQAVLAEEQKEKTHISELETKIQENQDSALKKDTEIRELVKRIEELPATIEKPPQVIEEPPQVIEEPPQIIEKLPPSSPPTPVPEQEEPKKEEVPAQKLQEGGAEPLEETPVAPPTEEAPQPPEQPQPPAEEHPKEEKIDSQKQEPSLLETLPKKFEKKPHGTKGEDTLSLPADILSEQMKQFEQETSQENKNPPKDKEANPDPKSQQKDKT